MREENKQIKKGPEIINAILVNDKEILDEVYLSYKPEFIHWGRTRFSLSEEDLTDCWQDSVIAFYEQVVAKKLTSLEVELKTYLFAIGKNKILYKLRGQASAIRKEEIFADTYSIVSTESEGYDGLDGFSEEQKKKLQKAMGSLSAKNRQLLIERYYEGLSLEEIQRNGDFKSINTVSASLSRALSTLKKKVHHKIFLPFFVKVLSIGGIN